VQPAVCYVNSGNPQLVAASADIADTDSPNFNSGRLTVEFASGGTVDDRLAIRGQGTAVGQIGLAGQEVTYGGVSIGSFTGGETIPLVVTFNENATPSAVEALVRSVTFANVSREPATNHRYLRLTLIDDTGKPSNMQIAHVVVDPRPALIVGDFDADGLVSAADIDFLAAAVRAGDNEPKFDLTGDGLVDQTDHTYWVEQARETRLGDADLNGAVEFADFTALAEHFGQSGGWADGDFDGDGFVSFADFVLLIDNFGKTAALIQQV
jgi:hypothetical protein